MNIFFLNLSMLKIILIPLLENLKFPDTKKIVYVPRFRLSQRESIANSVVYWEIFVNLFKCIIFILWSY